MKTNRKAHYFASPITEANRNNPNPPTHTKPDLQTLYPDRQSTSDWLKAQAVKKNAELVALTLDLHPLESLSAILGLSTTAALSCARQSYNPTSPNLFNAFLESAQRRYERRNPTSPDLFSALRYLTKR